ncbi:MAG: MauE/DoxX family redox-associated membrane protein [Pyrinomonadaceae bacterium]
MDLFLLIVRIFLAVVFAVAGFAKLADLAGAEKAASGFGIPERWARPYAVLLSALEIVIAGSLLSTATSFYGAVAAAQLLIIFIAGMAYQLYKGRTPDCHCFGQLYSKPVSKLSVLRNAALLAIALVPVVRGRDGQGLDIADVRLEMMPTLIGILVAALVVGVLMYLRRIADQQRTILRRIEMLELMSHDGHGHAAVTRDEAGDPMDALPIGALFPEFELPDVSGTTFTLDDLTVDGEPLLLLFVGPNCSPCAALVPEIGEWRARLAGKAEIVLVSSGTVRENRAKFGTDGLVLIERDREVAKSVGARWTPTALFVSGDGRVASNTAVGDEAIRALIERIEAGQDTSGTGFYALRNDPLGRPPKIGKTIPQFELKDIAGRRVSHDDILGRRTLVAFWSPGCPHCGAMLGSLREWERRRGPDDPAIVVFTDGPVEDNSALGLTSPVVIDPGYKVAASLGMFGTPSAVLVGEDGRIQTETAVGARNIWALVSRSADGSGTEANG